MEFYTYLHCKPNGEPFYVGKGSGKRSIDFRNGRNKLHKAIIQDVGESNVMVFVFRCESEEQAFYDERHQIKQLRKNGFDLANMSIGGEGAASGCSRSIETRLKMSASKIGIPKSKEHREKLANSSKGNKNASGMRSEETRLKMSASQKGNTNCKGRIMSQETKNKISETKKAALKGIEPVFKNGQHKRWGEQ